MERDRLIRFAESLRRDVGEIRNINRGGCGIVARAIYKELVKIGVDAKIVVCGFLNDHVVVEVAGKYVDATGIIAETADDLEKYSAEKYGTNKIREVDLDGLNDMIRRVDIWNPRFKRSNSTRINKGVRLAVQAALADAEQLT